MTIALDPAALPIDTRLLTAFIFLFGLALGSFLNVCIYRLPRGMSVVAPRSACPKCGKPVRSWDNIPVLSWMILGGRCRDCKAPISMRYPIVELVSAFAITGSFLSFGFGLLGLKFAIFNHLLLGLILTDADMKILPDAMTLPGFALGLVFAIFTPPGTVFAGSEGAVPEWKWRLLMLVHALLGAALGAFFLWLVGFLYKLARGVEGMGFGDVKLMAMVGAFLGMRLTALTLLLGALAGSLGGLLAMLVVYLKRRRRYARRQDGRARATQSARLALKAYQMPFGVFLGAAAVFAEFWGQSLVAWYLSFFPT